jgi:hypothetical protein
MHPERFYGAGRSSSSKILPPQKKGPTRKIRVGLRLHFFLSLAVPAGRYFIPPTWNMIDRVTSDREASGSATFRNSALITSCSSWLLFSRSAV